MVTTLSVAFGEVNHKLCSFKSLQEEMSQMEPGGGGAVNGVPPEQYQHL